MIPYYDNGTVTIWHGDCRDVLPGLSQMVDLIVTDPPYGINYRSTRGSILGDDGSLDVIACLRQACARLRVNRHLYVFGKFDLSELTVCRTAELIWDKGRTGMGTGSASVPWASAHEPIQFAVWSPYKSHERVGGLTARIRRGSVLRVPKENNGRGTAEHPAEKPAFLIRQLIESSSIIGETVLDPFMGSGSTLVAARQEGRKAIGIELEERYCEIAARRCAQEVLDFGASA